MIEKNMTKPFYKVHTTCLETDSKTDANKLRNELQKKGKHAWIETIMING